MRKKNWHGSLNFLKIKLFHAYIQKISNRNNPNRLIFKKKENERRKKERRKRSLTFYPFPSTQRQSLFTTLVFYGFLSTAVYCMPIFLYFCVLILCYFGTLSSFLVSLSSRLCYSRSVFAEAPCTSADFLICDPPFLSGDPCPFPTEGR